ncbi:hypothetical protein B0J13DRAFT_257293 [Dactylonectria estremocensis]|uniref:DUF6594 domain-containing protein n=1 Tax=Dactylonectria estremocensis TaxID=1079267 RepID=A0A9P9F0F0_9HYPO|nr:hypothetical protein B0J13DRAFT_257293 [Dactylonectria estremocensis]
MSQPELNRAETGLSQASDYPMLPIGNKAPAALGGQSPDQNRNAIDLEAGDNREHVPKGGFMALCARGQQDASQLVTRRFTEPTMFCLAKGAMRMEQVWYEYQEAVRLGSENETMFLNLRRELGDYQQFALQTKDMHGLEQPSSVFIDNFVRGIRSELNSEESRYTDGPSWDWALTVPFDKLDQLIRDIPHYPLGQTILASFMEKTEESGDNQHLYYPLKTIKILLSGVFNCLVASLVGAPVALQSLSITSQTGKVIIYLVFLLLFGFLVQGLAHGTNMQLVITLAYAGVLAATMR